MTRAKTYTTLEGEVVSLAGLDEQERRLVSLLRKRARTRPDWNDFDNFAFAKVGTFYDARGMTRKKSARTPVFQIVLDLSGRLAVASGMARLEDYRDELEEIIRTQFRTQREFCQATGLAEDMVSHVLRGRKHLAIDTLENALHRIGYGLHIKPLPRLDAAEPRKRAKTKRRSAG
jgi:hypothetical protein